jgi:hypothetical protein
VIKVDFNFARYIREMSEERLNNFALDSGTTPNYIKVHLIYKKKIPRPEMIDALVSASKGDFSKHQFISWLYDLKVA